MNALSRINVLLKFGNYMIKYFCSILNEKEVWQHFLFNCLGFDTCYTWSNHALSRINYLLSNRLKTRRINRIKNNTVSNETMNWSVLSVTPCIKPQYNSVIFTSTPNQCTYMYNFIISNFYDKNMTPLIVF